MIDAIGTLLAVVLTVAFVVMAVLSFRKMREISRREKRRRETAEDQSRRITEALERIAAALER